MKNQSFVEVTNESESPKSLQEDTVSVYDPYSNLKHQLMPEKTCAYKNVFWNETHKEWVGSVHYKERYIRASSKNDASHCARMLNSRCLTAGCYIPNPEAGFLNARELRALRAETEFSFPTLNLKSEFTSFTPASLDMKETESPFYSSFPSLSDSDFHRFTSFTPTTPDGSGLPPISPAFDLPPCSTQKDKLLTEFHNLLSPRICHEKFEKDNYKALNKTMFNYMSDFLPKDDDMDDFLDDLPFSGNWSSELLSSC